MNINTTTVLNKVNTSVVCLFNTFVLNSSDMTTTYGDRLRTARKHKNLSQDQLAQVSGVKQGTISKIERGDQEISTFDVELSMALDIHPLWLKNGDERYKPLFMGGDYIEAEYTRVFDTVKEHKKLITENKIKKFPRVVGTAQCGDNGYYMDLEGGDGYIEFESEPGSIAIRIKGHSMHPAIREGWFVVIEPRRTPDIGEYVLVKFKDGKKMVKELLQIKNDAYILLSVNSNERITAQFDELDGDIQSISAIVPPFKHKQF